MLQFTKSTIVSKETPIVKIPANTARMVACSDGYRVKILDHELKACILKCSVGRCDGTGREILFWMEMRCDTMNGDLYLNNCKYSTIDENTALLSRIDSVIVDAKFETVEE